ncbi:MULTISPECIES: sugar phosphate isomerase/epimerase family protein [Larkinella]|uniref:Sugar phosphate isomerase/epimerase n=1 Tax=Larkinella humicola TaxID=2607654 RepID=A0A5N1JBN9_9BACT|nr:sugar phosphate isomerase/epimerase family protein [Larkinella humicola]KAA9352689.1 sugar phosphate isomerase/epimerase [Larkinella humicola]
MNRRTALRQTLGFIGLSTTASLPVLNAKSSLQNPNNQRFRVGACDWSIGQSSKIEAFDVAKTIGLDGIQVNLGSEKNDMHLRRKDLQKAWREAAKRTGVQIGGLALGELNNIPYKSDPRAEQWVQDSVGVAKALGAKNILLAFFNKGDLKNDPQGTQVVIERLKAVAPKAEKAGIVLAIESWLSAEEHMAIIDAVASPAVKVYYDVCNSTVMGYDILKEIRWLGKQKQICEFHFKENSYLLGQGKVNYPEVRKAIDAIQYGGWVHIEGAVPEGKNMLESYTYNNKFVREILA